MYTELRDNARSHVSTGVSEVGCESCGRPKGGELLVNWSDLEGFPGAVAGWVRGSSRRRWEVEG